MNIVITLLCLCVCAFGQEWKADKKDPNRKITEHLVQVYDKFRDVTFTMTRADDVTLSVKKKRAAAALMIGYENPKTGEAVKELFFALSPETVSVAGNFTNEAFSNDVSFWESYKGQRNWLHFSSNAEVILLVNNKRIKLPNTEKPLGFDGTGQWRTQVGTVLPIETFREMVIAGEWEMLIGDVVIDFKSKDKSNLAKRVQPRLQSLISLLK